MDYKKVYDTLMNRAKGRQLDCYVEKHHIVPVCLDSSSTETVELTLREHFVAHRLLTKIYPNNSKLAYAFWMMCNRTKPDSRAYAEGKVKLLEAIQRDKRYPPSQKGKIRSAETREKKRLNMLGKTRSEETKRKIAATLRAKGIRPPGIKGKVLVSKDGKSIFVSKESVGSYLEYGYIKGREKKRS